MSRGPSRGGGGQGGWFPAKFFMFMPSSGPEKLAALVWLGLSFVPSSLSPLKRPGKTCKTTALRNKAEYSLKKREGVPEVGTKPLKALRGYRASNRGSNRGSKGLEKHPRL